MFAHSRRAGAGDHVGITVKLEATAGESRRVEYRWDVDTDILSAQLKPEQGAKGMSGPVGVEGADGSWLILDVGDGRINGVEVAVWPEVRKHAGLAAPARVQEAGVLVPARKSRAALTSVEMETPIAVESDEHERIFHFTIGKPRKVRAVRLAADLLMEIDASGRLAGLWLLNVPPFPDEP
jgi:hypothetical protein